MINDMASSTLEILPVEIFHQILNYLDTPSIFDSFYQICQRLNVIVTSYNRYKLDFSSISRSDFDIFLFIIYPKNIISLILSDDDRTPGQIGLFLLLINTQELHRLRSLTLLQIEECHLLLFLKNVSLRNLKALSIQWRGDSPSDNDHFEVLSLLSSVISSQNLRYLDLNLWIYEIKNLSWPTHCTLQHLCIDNCSFSEYRHILHYSPRLKTFIMNNRSMFNITNPLFFSSHYLSYHQLRSLILKSIEKIRMTEFEYLLSLTPSLVHLKLIGNGRLQNDAFDGLRWENFMENNLRSLEKFQFSFTTQRNGYQTADDALSLIIPFSSNFWKEKKRWFVRCDFIKSLSQIRLYSIPICQSHFEYICESDMISQSTLDTMDDDVQKITDVHGLTVNLSAATIEQKDQSINYPLFPQVNEVLLEMANQITIISSQFYSTLLNPLHLVKISLNIYFDNDSTEGAINAIVNLLEQAPNIHTFHNNNKSADAKIICAIVPRHVKYLQVKVDCFTDMTMIVEQLDHLSSIGFQFLNDLQDHCEDFVEWLCQRKTLFTFRGNPNSLHAWFDNNPTRFKKID